MLISFKSAASKEDFRKDDLTFARERLRKHVPWKTIEDFIASRAWSNKIEEREAESDIIHIDGKEICKAHFGSTAFKI